MTQTRVFVTRLGEVSRPTNSCITGKNTLHLSYLQLLEANGLFRRRQEHYSADCGPSPARTRRKCGLNTAETMSRTIVVQGSKQPAALYVVFFRMPKI